MLFTVIILSLLLIIKTTISIDPCKIDAGFEQRVRDHLNCGADDHVEKTFRCTIRKDKCPAISGIFIYGSRDGPGQHQFTCVWGSHCKGECPDTAPKPTERSWWCTLKDDKSVCHKVAGYSVESLYGGVCAYRKISAARAHIAINNNINMGNFCFSYHRIQYCNKRAISQRTV